MEPIQPTLHKVQYYETDSMRIVHHSNYIRWFEEARVDFLEAIGHGYDSIEAAGFESPVLGVTCEYKSMTRFGEYVKIYAGIKHYSGVKMTIAYRIEDAQAGELRCAGESSHCFTQGGKPVHLRRAFPALHGALQEALEHYQAE